MPTIREVHVTSQLPDLRQTIQVGPHTLTGDGPKEIACAQDAKSLLRCVNGVYQVGEPCRNACLSTSGRVLCQ